MSLHTCVTGAGVFELKFIVDSAVGAGIRQWARVHLEPDPHGNGPAGDEYSTTSVYFDTRQLDVFHRRGSFGRAKYRIRRYGTTEDVYLERKLRKPGVLIKRRTIATLPMLDRLAHTTCEDGWPGDWFHRRVVARRLRPVCELSYQRTARGVISSEGLARLTLDDDLRAAPTADARFGTDTGVPVLGRRMILELKYRGFLPAIFRRLVEEFALRAQAASKYRLGMMALGLVTANEEPPFAGPHLLAAARLEWSRLPSGSLADVERQDRYRLTS